MAHVEHQNLVGAVKICTFFVDGKTIKNISINQKNIYAIVLGYSTKIYSIL